jgi:hypothetical protein
MPVKGAVTKADTTYTVTADVAGVAIDKLVMNQKLEANTLKVVATMPAIRSRATSRSTAGGLAGLSQADRGRRRHQAAGDPGRCEPVIFWDRFGPAVSGAIPVR